MHIHSSEHSQTFDIARVISVVSYLTIVGWVVSLVIFGKQKSMLAGFHLRQSLGLIIVAACLSLIPLIGWILNVVVAVFWVLSVFHAAKGEYYSVPVVGGLFQTHLRFIT